MTDIPRPERPTDALMGAVRLPTAARPTGASTVAGARPATARPPSAPRPPRLARLTVKTVDPWSVLKFGAVFSIAILVIWVVTVGCLYSVLSEMGVWDHLNNLLAQFTVKDGSNGYQITASTGTVVSWAAVIGGVNAVLFTALTTLGAFVYNLCSSLTGGIDVTLTERR